MKHFFVKAEARVSNRAEKSHQPTRRRERQMCGFRDARRTRAFLSCFGPIRRHFALPRHKMNAACHRAVSQSPLLGMPMERSIAHPSLLADILVSKFADHQPLYRQSAVAARDGVKLDPASMKRRVGQCVAVCEPLTEALRHHSVATSMWTTH